MKSKHSTGISATKSRIPISIHTSNSAFSFPGGAGRQASNSLCGMQILLDRPETTERGCLINHGRWMERRNRTHASGRDRRRRGRIYSFYLHTYEGVGFYFFSFVDIYLYESGPPPNKHTHTHAHAGGVTTVLPRYLAGGGASPDQLPISRPVPTAVIRFPRRTVLIIRDGYPNTASAGVSRKDKIWALSITLSFPNRAGVHAKTPIRSHPRENRGGAGSRDLFFLLVRVSAEVRSADLPAILVTQRDIPPPRVLRHKPDIG